MRLKAIGFAVLCCGVALGSAAGAAQEKTVPPKPDAKAVKPAAPAVDEKAMMEAWAAAGTPGAAHHSLSGMEGTWTAKVKSWMVPGATPSETDATSENKMALGGRFLEQRFQSSFMGQPFNGIGYIGFDNVKKKYVFTWMDNTGTMIMAQEGVADSAGKVITAAGRVPDAFTKKVTTVKSVTTLVDPDHHVYEMWATAPDGTVYKNLEIHYTRKK
jgi:hypothetical protein